MLTPEQLQELAAAIDGRHARLEAALRQDAARLREDTGLKLAAEVDDSGDETTADLMTEIDNAAVGRDLEELHALESARHRLGSADFGTCTDCGEAIGFERLRAEPSALRCIACQRVHDKAHHSPAPSL